MKEELHAYREEYVAHLRRVISRVQSDHEKVASELWIEVSTTSLCRNFYRIDVLSNDGETKSVEVNIDLPTSETCELDYQGIQLRLEPFAWNDLEVFVSGVTISNENLDNWFTRWFDEEEVFEEDETGLSGVIHSLSIQSTGSDSVIDVDLGSAPIVALIELLDLLRKIGALTIRLSAPIEIA